MPFLFCLAAHNALEEVQAELLFGQTLFAFLDDVCVFARAMPHDQFVGRQVAFRRIGEKATMDLGPEGCSDVVRTNVNIIVRATDEPLQVAEFPPKPHAC